MANPKPVFAGLCAELQGLCRQKNASFAWMPDFELTGPWHHCSLTAQDADRSVPSVFRRNDRKRISRPTTNSDATDRGERSMSVSTRTSTGWDAVVTGLKAEGVPFVFGLPGDPGHLYDQLYAAVPDGGPRPIGVRYETSGAFMAMAYTRVTGTLAACFGCPGPGIANLVPGVLEAFSGCTPMLVLGVRAGRSTNGMGAFQETDHIGMMKPITKWATTVETAERIPWTIRRAAQLARSGKPGPVYVELPADIGMGNVEIPPYRRASSETRPGPSAEDLLRAADLIANAKRPLIITGGGCY